MKRSCKYLGGISAAALLALSGCGGGGSDSSAPASTASTASTTSETVTDEDKQAVLKSYADIANANYSDALADAKALKSAVDTFVSNPTETTFGAAKTAWLASRESYGQTEIFRLSNGPIDAEDGDWVEASYGALEGQINAWPLDENMIDYTVASDGSMTSGNIIDTAGSFTPSGGSAVDVTTITSDALSALNENGGDANIATGYHAIEFLLWGQDQDYSSFIDDTVTNGAMTAGERSYTDYVSASNADRRKAYLAAAAAKLVSDLTTVASAWSTTLSSDCSTDATGCYRGAFLGQLSGEDASKNIATDTALKQIMAGMGVFIKSELANERIAVAVLTPSEEDEHSCFSDNTHRDIALNYGGFVNVLKGAYNGKSYGTSIYSLLSSGEKNTIDTLVSSIDMEVSSINSVATSSRHFDYQVQPGDSQVATIKSVKNNLRSLGDEMVSVAGTFNITLTEDDVTDPEETQF